LHNGDVAETSAVIGVPALTAMVTDEADGEINSRARCAESTAAAGMTRTALPVDVPVAVDGGAPV
jgi:hypothetical protein